MSESRFALWRLRVVALLLLLVPLVYVDPRVVGVPFPNAFDFPKRCLVESACLLIFALFAIPLAAGEQVRLPRLSVLLPFLLFCSWTALSALWAPSRHAAWGEAVRWICYLAILAAAAPARSVPNGLRSLSVSCMASAAAVSVLSVLQFYGLDPLAFRGGLHRVYATLGNPNYVASFLSVSLPLAYWGWMSPGGKRRSAACLAVSLAGTAALLLTGSRAGAASLAAGCGAGLLASRSRIAPRRAAALAVAAAALALLLALPSPLNRYNMGTVNKIAELSPLPRGGAAWRIMVWRIALRMACARPLAGWGAGSFRLLYLPWQAEFLRDPAHAALVPLAEGGIDCAHDDYLETAVETGSIGLALFLWTLAASVPRTRRRDPCAAPPDWAGAGAYAGCAAMLADALVGFPFRLWAPAAVFFSLAGGAGRAGEAGPAIRLKGRGARIAAGIAPVPVLLFSLGFMAFGALAELHYARGISLFEQGQSGRAQEEFAVAAGWQPHHGRSRFFLGLCLSAEGDYAGALDEMNAAGRTYARQAIHVQTGRLLGKLRRREEALAEFDLAAAMLPRDPDAWTEKGMLLFGEGNPGGAAECFHRALLLRPGSYGAARNLAVCYDAIGRGDEALRLYERAIETGPADADVYVNAGTLRAKRGDAPRARGLWEKALAVDPGNTRARLNLERLGSPVAGSFISAPAGRNGEPANRRSLNAEFSPAPVP